MLTFNCEYKQKGLRKKMLVKMLVKMLEKKFVIGPLMLEVNL